MRNKSKIQGDNNSVIQGIKNEKNKADKSSNGYLIIGLIIAILTLAATLIIGWDNIGKFFSK